MGTILGPIREVNADHIRVGAAAPIHLPAGTQCDYVLGPVVRVVYVERSGLQEVVRGLAVTSARLAPI